jgi:hypothetical protein
LDTGKIQTKSGKSYSAAKFTHLRVNSREFTKFHTFSREFTWIRVNSHKKL